MAQTPLENWAGVTGTHRVTPAARRMIVLAGSGKSFDEAASDLKELSWIQVSNDIVRRVCDEEGIVMKKWILSHAQPQEKFAKAKGKIEFSTDGTMVNTMDGWREIRLSVLGKREAGASADAVDWEDRLLEEPSSRIAICAIAACDLIGESWKALAKNLGLPEDQDLSILADGARWIWNQAALRFKGQDVQWVVDIYHVMLYLYGAVAHFKKDAAAQWVGQQVIELINKGGPEFIKHLNATGPPKPKNKTAGEAENTTSTTSTAISENEPNTKTSPDGWAKLLNYLEENRDSLWYARRLKEGLPIGSGLIEGGCKNVLGKRLKLNSARWRPRRAEHMGAIRCLQYSDLWENYWNSKKSAA